MAFFALKIPCPSVTCRFDPDRRHHIKTITYKREADEAAFHFSV
jgi:hypothetical protein